MKKILAALLMLVMLVILTASAMAFPADQVRIGSTMLYSGNYLESGKTTVTTTVPASGSYAYFQDGVLTLNNFAFEGDGGLKGDDRYAVYAGGDLEIVVNAGTTNTIRGSFSTQNVGGIKASNITISGTGTLNALSDRGAGICHAKSIVVSDATVTVEGYNSALITSQSAGKRTLTVNSGSLRLRSQYNIVVPKPEDFDVVLGAGMRAYGSWSPSGSSKESYKSTSTLYKYIEIVKGPDPEIWVGGVGMASGDYLANGAAVPTTSKPSGGYAFYQDGVLTLNNYSYTGAGRAMGSEGYYALVLTNKNLKLSLMGSNALMASDSSKVYGIQVTEGSSLTIEQSGTGTLMVKDAYCGIYVKGDITLNSGSVTIDNILQDGILTWGNLEIKGGKLDVDSRVRGISLGSDGKTVSIEGGEVKIVADGHGILTNLNNCAVEIKGGKTQIFGGYHGVNMSKSTLEITGGEVDIKATSTDSEKDAQYTAVNVAIFVTTGMHVRASTEPDGTLGAYVKSIHNTYDWIKVGPIPESYTVTFDANGGTGTMAPQTFTEGAAQALTLNAFTREGYTFTGWNLAADGSSTAYADGAVGMLTSDITLYAQWEKNPHEHTWDEEAWSGNDTHHWHECTGEDCDVTEDADKDGYGEHEYVDGVCACGKEEPAAPVIPTIAVTPKTLTLLMGETSTLTATVTPADAAGYTVVWSSGDETIAEVDQNGAVTAVKPGKAIITATLNAQARAAGGVIADTCEVTVIAPEMELPQTGDESNLLLWAGMLLASCTAGVVLLRRKRED